MTIPLSSSSMEGAEAMVFLGVNGRANGGPQLKFHVVTLEGLRDARAMMRLLHEYHSTGEIHVANLHQVDCASTLDAALVEMKDALASVFHPAPGADGEELVKKLDLGKEPEKPARTIRRGGGSVLRGWEGEEDAIERAELELDGLSVKEKTRPVKPRSGVEEEIREGLRRGEAELLRMKDLKARADSLLDLDVKGVVSPVAVREIQSSAYTLLNCLRSLQEDGIPRTLLEIKKARNQPVVMPQPHH